MKSLNFQSSFLFHHLLITPLYNGVKSVMPMLIQNLEIYAESSDASKSIQSIALEPKSEKYQDETKNEESIAV